MRRFAGEFRKSLSKFMTRLDSFDPIESSESLNCNFSRAPNQAQRTHFRVFQQ